MAVDYSQAEKDREMIIRMRQRATARSFERMRAKIDEQIATMNMSTTSERAKRQQLEEIRNELQKALGTFYSDLEDGLKSDMISIGESVLSDSEAFYKSLNMPISMSITSFPVEIMENVINGTVYEEKWFLSSALWGDYQSKLDDINTVVAEGIGLNKSIYDIAKDLEKYVDPNARKDWSWAKVYPGTAKTVDYNAQRLARTLVSHAYQQNVVRQAQANPFASGVKWEASGGERMCEICEERDGKIFPVDDVPLDHPNGMCTFSVETPSMMEMSDILADWVNGEPTDWDDQLNAYYEGRQIDHKSAATTTAKKDEKIINQLKSKEAKKNDASADKVPENAIDNRAEDKKQKKEQQKRDALIEKLLSKKIDDMNRRELVDIAREVYIRSGGHMNLPEDAAKTRFSALVTEQTTPQLRKYLKRHKKDFKKK